MVVACGGFDLEHAIAKREDGYIERAAAKIIDKDGDILLLVDTVRERACRRLVDDTQDLKAGDLPGIFCSLPLGIVEVSRDGDDCL